MNRLYLKHTRADSLYRQVVYLTLTSNMMGVGGIQRKFRVGYSRACHMRDWMMAERVILYDEVTGEWRVIMTRPNLRKRYGAGAKDSPVFP